MVTSWPAVRGSYDVVLGGGGIIGCASAYFLAKRIPAERICVIERDPSVSALLNIPTARIERDGFAQDNDEIFCFSSTPKPPLYCPWDPSGSSSPSQETFSCHCTPPGFSSKQTSTSQSAPTIPLMSILLRVATCSWLLRKEKLFSGKTLTFKGVCLPLLTMVEDNYWPFATGSMGPRENCLIPLP